MCFLRISFSSSHILGLDRSVDLVPPLDQRLRLILNVRWFQSFLIRSNSNGYRNLEEYATLVPAVAWLGLDQYFHWSRVRWLNEPMKDNHRRDFRRNQYSFVEFWSFVDLHFEMLHYRNGQRVIFSSIDPYPPWHFQPESYPKYSSAGTNEYAISPPTISGTSIDTIDQWYILCCSWSHIFQLLSFRVNIWLSYEEKRSEWSHYALYLKVTWTIDPVFIHEFVLTVACLTTKTNRWMRNECFTNENQRAKNDRTKV